MRRKEVRLRKERAARRYRRVLDRVRDQPRLLFVERLPLRAVVSVELARDGGRGRPSGFWRGNEFHRVERVVETRREHDAIYYRTITDRGCFDLRRARRLDPWTMRVSVEWELIAELEAIEVKRPF